MKFFFLGNEDKMLINTHVEPIYFAKEYITRIEKSMNNAYIQNFKSDTESIEFQGPPFRYVWNGWNLFNTISKGKINVEIKNSKIYIRHKIWFFEMFIIACLFMIIPVMGLFDSITFRIIFASGIWIIYLFHALFAIYRINTYLAAIVKQINELPRFKTHAKIL